MALYANNLSNNYPQISGIVPLFVTNGGERWDGGTGVVYDEGIPLRWDSITDGSTIYMLEGQEEGTSLALTKSGRDLIISQVGRGLTAWQEWSRVSGFAGSDWLMITKPIDDNRLIFVQGAYDSESRSIICYKSTSGSMYGDLDYFFGWHLKEYDAPSSKGLKVAKKFGEEVKQLEIIKAQYNDKNIIKMYYNGKEFPLS